MVQPGAAPGSGQGVVIAIDGPSGSGKSSAARGAATRLGLRYLDTGAMYRAVTWWLIEHEVDLADTGAIVSHGLGLSIEVSTEPGTDRVWVDGVDATAEIRNRRVSNVVSLVAAVPQIREHLIGLQRAIIADAEASAPGIVAEGRDIGTVVAPGAAVKVFLTASEQVRAERRAAELAGRQAAAPATAELTRTEQAQRDRRDAPQTQVAADAVELDATDLGLEDVIEAIVALAAARQQAGQ
jgi:cytidylate kinase